jgi:hypothetical protein
MPKSSLQGCIHGVSCEDYLGDSHPPAEHTMSSFSIAQCLQFARELESVSDSARLDIELILCHVLQKIARGFLPGQIKRSPLISNNCLILFSCDAKLVSRLHILLVSANSGRCRSQ